MVPLCGNCPGRVCKNCVRRWYSSCVPGAIVFEGRCKCPVCKTIPKYEVIKSLALSHFRNHRVTKKNKGKVCLWDPAFLYGACVGCLKLLPALERDCARAAPDVAGFRCNDCRKWSLAVAADAASFTKQCPGCGAQVEKKGGCNHISCPTAGGGTHWCSACGVGGSDFDGYAFNDRTIYDHMLECAGIFEDNAGDDMDD